MQPMPNRMGLGLRPPMQSYGQGPSMSALAQQNHLQPMGMGAPPPNFVPPGQQRVIQLFVGSISGGIQDPFLNDLLSVRSQI
jgi:RNA-binding protein 25